MIHLTFTHILLLTFAAILAGIVDTLAGGGGLITLPALLVSGVSPLLALGTNKLQSCMCEASATLVFRKKSRIPLSSLKRGLGFTLLGSALGTLLLQVIQIRILERLVPFFLLAVFLMNLLAKSSAGSNDESGLDPALSSCLIPLGLGIGFYNGFFGPGTGAIWAVSLRKFLKLTLKNATMIAKPLNLIGNLTALTIFVATGNFSFWAGVAMGVGAVSGGIIGAHLVAYKDAKWLKMVFNVLLGVSVCGAFWAG